MWAMVNTCAHVRSRTDELYDLWRAIASVESTRIGPQSDLVVVLLAGVVIVSGLIDPLGMAVDKMVDRMIGTDVDMPTELSTIAIVAAWIAFKALALVLHAMGVRTVL